MKNLTLKSFFYYALCLTFMIVFVFHEFNQFLGINDVEDLRTSIGRFCFEQLQTLIYSIGFIMMYVIVFNNLSLGKVILSYMIAFLFIVLDGNVYFHEILVNNDLYFKFTQTNAPFFLHAFGVFAFIVSLFSLGYLILVKPTIIKILTVFIGSSFYIFFCVLHLFLGRQAYVDYLEHYQLQISSVLENNQKYEGLCLDLKYQCFIIEKNDTPKIILSDKNKMNKNVNVNEEAIEVYNHFRKDFLDNNYSEKVYITESFSRKNLRAMNFGFKKIDTKLFVIISSSTFAYGLDLYLFYITFLTFVFFWVWTYLIVKLNKFHSKLPWLKKANFI